MDEGPRIATMNVRNFNNRCTKFFQNSPSLFLKIPLSRAIRLWYYNQWQLNLIWNDSARKTPYTTTERFVREVFKPAICDCKSSSTNNSKRVIFLSQLIVNRRLQGRFRHTSLTVYVRRKKENEFYHCLHYQRPTENKYLLLRNVNLYEKSKVSI